MKHNPDVVASIFGMLWGLIPLSYWILGTGTLSYVSIFLFFMTIILFFGIQKMSKLAIYFSTIIFLMTAVSFFAELSSEMKLSPYLAIFVFLININILLAEVKKASTFVFFSTFYRTTSLMAFIHIVLVYFDLVGNHFGRSLFFGNTQPNLGGEIYVVAVISGALAMRRFHFILYLVPVLISDYFLQSRTSLVVIFAILLIKLNIERGGAINLRSLSFGSAFTAVALAVLAMSGSSRRWILENVLLADDHFRGASSGFLSGRDARWQDAWNSFADRPFFGHGLNWYVDGTSLGAHSPFLYSLVYCGIFGLIFWCFFLVRFLIIARCNRHMAFLLLPCFLMFMLNDRFLNSNSFPLLLYFIVIRLSQFEPKFTLHRSKLTDCPSLTKGQPWHASR